MRELTPRQLEILELIKRHLATSGFPPTRAEIAAELGFRSANAAEEHLKALARKGVIELTSGASRGIRLLLLPASVGDESRASGRVNPAVASPRRQPGHPVVMPSATRAIAGRSQPRAAAFGAHTSIDDDLPPGLLPGQINAVQLALTLPLVGRVSAGSPILAEQHVEASFAVDPELFSARPDYLLRVRGLSMRDAGILDGDLLAVRRAAEARNGQIVVARIGNDVTVKRFQRVGANRIDLLAENPDFDPIRVDPRSDEFALEGIGVGLIRKNPL
jgi:repressor LexA